jgi:alpha-tubulin suppressor-like RCC1 family protein
MVPTESGRVFSWGCNTNGESGLNHYNETYLPSIVELSNKTPIKEICCENSYNLLLSSDGDFYWFGWNGKKKTSFLKKLSINNLKLIDIELHFIFGFSAALSDNDIYYVWGFNREKFIEEPKETKFESFLDIFAHYFGITYKTLKIS